MGGDRDAKRQKTTEMDNKVEEKVEKTETAKVDNNKNEESAGSVDFEELRDDLFREAAKLVSDDPSTKIAIFFTPPSSSSQSDVSMYSFGHPSVDGVVKTFLKDEEDEDDAEEEDDDDAEEEDGSSQGFWWEDKKLLESTNPEELQAAYDRMVRLRDRMVLQIDDEAKLKLAHDSGNQQEDLLLPNDKEAQPKP
ncbi:PREDICTED: uncharacterized protein LOC104765018 [Camelina sativa]|uniref:Uncharacterized protein LOC104765018 n=1 Tax=Camelina sativa TaxID=90675 RepID=A0ABM0XJN9_CAMSA|nr:PREDICTED: uncharacterized protein LOC104765018 [Camelina sativa]